MFQFFRLAHLLLKVLLLKKLREKLQSPKRVTSFCNSYAFLFVCLLCIARRSEYIQSQTAINKSTKRVP